MALKIIPILEPKAVAERVFSAIYHKEKEVYIPWYCGLLGLGMTAVRAVSEDLRMFVIKMLMGNGMKTLECRGTKL